MAVKLSASRQNGRTNPAANVPGPQPDSFRLRRNSLFFLSLARSLYFAHAELLRFQRKSASPKKGENGGSCRLRCLVPSGHNFRGLDCRLAAISLVCSRWASSSRTSNVFIFLRSFYQDSKDLGPAVKTLQSTLTPEFPVPGKHVRMVQTCNSPCAGVLLICSTAPWKTTSQSSAF